VNYLVCWSSCCARCCAVLAAAAVALDARRRPAAVLVRRRRPAARRVLREAQSRRDTHRSRGARRSLSSQSGARRGLVSGRRKHGGRGAFLFAAPLRSEDAARDPSHARDAMPLCDASSSLRFQQGKPGREPIHSHPSCMMHATREQRLWSYDLRWAASGGRPSRPPAFLGVRLHKLELSDRQRLACGLSSVCAAHAFGAPRLTFWPPLRRVQKSGDGAA
jgi:hypothetical protein